MLITLFRDHTVRKVFQEGSGYRDEIVGRDICKLIEGARGDFYMVGFDGSLTGQIECGQRFVDFTQQLNERIPGPEPIHCVKMFVCVNRDSDTHSMFKVIFVYKGNKMTFLPCDNPIGSLGEKIFEIPQKVILSNIHHSYYMNAVIALVLEDHTLMVVEITEDFQFQTVQEVEWRSTVDTNGPIRNIHFDSGINQWIIHVGDSVYVSNCVQYDKQQIPRFTKIDIGPVKKIYHRASMALTTNGDLWNINLHYDKPIPVHIGRNVTDAIIDYKWNVLCIGDPANTKAIRDGYTFISANEFPSGIIGWIQEGIITEKIGNDTLWRPLIVSDTGHVYAHIQDTADNKNIFVRVPYFDDNLVFVQRSSINVKSARSTAAS